MACWWCFTLHLMPVHSLLHLHVVSVDYRRWCYWSLKRRCYVVSSSLTQGLSQTLLNGVLVLRKLSYTLCKFTPKFCCLSFAPVSSTHLSTVCWPQFIAEMIFLSTFWRKKFWGTVAGSSIICAHKWYLFSFKCSWRTVAFLCLRQHSGQRHHVFRVFVHPCVSPEQILSARCRGYLLTEFDQTFTNNGLQGKDNCVKFFGQMVKGQGHGEVKYAPTCTFWYCTCHMLAEPL